MNKPQDYLISQTGNLAGYADEILGGIAILALALTVFFGVFGVGAAALKNESDTDED